VQQSDEERFTEFVRAHSASLFRTGFLITGDYQRAEDLLQSTLVRLYQRWPRVEAMERPVGYARKVLVNQAVSWWHRRSSREAPMLVLHEPGWGGGVDEVTEHERVWKAVVSLPPRQRAVTVLRYYEDLSEAEIAETLGVARGTVKSHGHAATRRLAELLGEPTATPSQPTEEATS
jgi:RNA polymerase sigma-70 factor (sigma-E family)